MNANLTAGLLSCGPYHNYSGEEFTSGKMQAADQGMKPCQQQMNLCISDAAASPQRLAHPLSGLHQLAPVLLADYGQSKPCVTLNYYPGMLPAAKSCCNAVTEELEILTTLSCTLAGLLSTTYQFRCITDGQQ